MELTLHRYNTASHLEPQGGGLVGNRALGRIVGRGVRKMPSCIGVDIAMTPVCEASLDEPGCDIIYLIDGSTDSGFSPADDSNATGSQRAS